MSDDDIIDIDDLIPNDGETRGRRLHLVWTGARVSDRFPTEQRYCARCRSWVTISGWLPSRLDEPCSSCGRQWELN